MASKLAESGWFKKAPNEKNHNSPCTFFITTVFRGIISRTGLVLQSLRAHLVAAAVRGGAGGQGHVGGRVPRPRAGTGLADVASRPCGLSFVRSGFLSVRFEDDKGGNPRRVTHPTRPEKQGGGKGAPLRNIPFVFCQFFRAS